eukprot:TRINITY_DN63269_c0_g1_i1.p1 TRINITY_DN63269_c0_g1~~TRINITY_DN63269_c0_g1_i1.p1  ORF type:complete len:287 (+),score=53.46 TRINITY_DN63269_c0_g1_i1:37-897(+)
MGNSLPCCGGRLQSNANDCAFFVGEQVVPETPSDSDHNAILFTLGRKDGAVIKILSWNILCQYGYNAEYDFPFDGFNRHFESETDYFRRLQSTAEEIQVIVDMHAPDVVLLQECAEEHEVGHSEIGRQLQERIVRRGYQVEQVGEFLTAIKARSMKALELPRLERQKGKIHAVYSSGLNCVILNVHLAWDKAQSKSAAASQRDLKAVLLHVQKLYPEAEVFLAGDTNRVLAYPRTDPDAEVIEDLVAGLGTLCYPPGPTNVRWNKEKGKSEMTYADFALRCTSIVA